MLDRERWLRNDRMVRDLEPSYRARFEGVLKRMEVSGWRPLVMETRRGAVRQAWLRAKGFSKVRHSKHQDGLAMDVIDAGWSWEATPLGFMVKLAFAAKEEGLKTGLLWDMAPGPRTIAEATLRQGQPHDLVNYLAVNGRGWDPCHVEVP